MHTKYWLQNLMGRTPFEDSGTDRRVIRGDAGKSLARPTSQCRWKEGSLHVPNCKSFLVTEAERKHVR